MNEPVYTRPTSITFIGIFLIVVSLIMMSSAFNETVNLFSNEYKNGKIESESRDKTEYEPSFLFNTPEPITIGLTIFGLALSVYLLFASVNLLRLREWARRSIVILAWLYLAENALAVIAVILNWNTIFGGRSDSSADDFFVSFTNVFLLVGLVAIALTYVFAGFIIKKLGSPEIRNAMNFNSTSETVNKTT